MPPEALPPVLRVSFTEHVARAMDRHREADADRAARLGAAATLLSPLQTIQVALDGLVRTAEDRLEGIPDPYGLPLSEHWRQTLQHVSDHRDILRAAAAAADSMIEAIHQQVTRLETAMKKDKDKDEGPAADQEPPKLTTSGEPHPLQVGGYDADADPQLPAGESDVAAMKAGHTTRAQAEALNEAAAEEAGEDEDADEGDDKPKARQAPKKGPKKH